MKKKPLLLLIPIIIFGYFFVKHIYEKNLAMEREILPEEFFLVGKWSSVLAIDSTGKKNVFEQGHCCSVLRRDNGTGLREYHGFKPYAFSWHFDATDSTFYTFKSEGAIDTTISTVKYIAEDTTLLITFKKDNATIIQKKFTGEEATISDKKLKYWGF